MFKPLEHLQSVDPWRWVVSIFVILVSFFIGAWLKSLFLDSSRRFDQKDRPVYAAMLSALGRSFPLLSFSFSFFLSVKMLMVLGSIGLVLLTCSQILITLAFGYTLYLLIEVPCSWWSTKVEQTQSKMDDMLVPIVESTSKIILVVLILVQVAQILSQKPLTSIIAGLGIGGLAIALASQETIKNFFGSVMLMSDRPFEIGDRIVVDGFDGPVKQVGLRSTIIETLEGHKVTIPNAKLADKSIRNISARENIRRILNLSLPPDTKHEKIQEALLILKDILKDHEGVKEPLLPHVYFNDIKDNCFNLFAIYWYHPAAYWDFMAHAEQVNLQIVEKFSAAGIQFSWDTKRIINDTHIDE